MGHTSEIVPAREFHATKGGAAGQVSLFAAMALGTAWLTYGSLDPNFWSGFYYAELDFIGSIMNLFPVMVRVLICAALTVAIINVIITKLQRNADGQPLLILSEAGVSGFANGRAAKHTFISWDDFKSATVINKSELGFHAKPAHMLGKRHAIGVSLPEIGVKYADMAALIESYQAAAVLAKIQGRAPVPVQRFATSVQQEPVATFTATARRAEPQPRQFAKPATPDFGRRMTRL